jgi:tRNA(Ser,Leu) C12 N-acetylase TAN1
MSDWNILISTYQGGYQRACRALRKLGSVESTPYHNVIAMAATDPMALLESIERRTDEVPALYDAISRVAPAKAGFRFGSVDEFKEKAEAIVRGWAPALAERSFHVRLRRRGAHHEIHAHDVERHLDEALLDALAQAGSSGKISFSDPDAVIAIDTVDDCAGLALWTRDDLARHRLLRPD